MATPGYGHYTSDRGTKALVVEASLGLVGSILLIGQEKESLGPGNTHNL